MTYELPDWQNEPSTATPLNATNLGKYNTAVADLDSRVSTLESTGVGGGVASVTAGDDTVTVGGTATDPTVAVNEANLTIAESQVTNLTSDLATKVPTSRTITAGSGLTGGGDLSANRTLSLALVPNPPTPLTYASTLTPDASQGNFFECTLTGDATLAAPSNPTNGQRVLLRFYASGASRSVSFDSALALPGSITSPLTIASGSYGDVALIYTTTAGEWSVAAAQAYA